MVIPSKRFIVFQWQAFLKSFSQIAEFVAGTCNLWKYEYDVEVNSDSKFKYYLIKIYAQRL